MAEGPADQSRTKDEVCRILDALGIEYRQYTHPAVFTGEDAARHWDAIDGTAVKNLFLRNKKGDRHYLVIVPIARQADLRHLARVVGDDRLSFGSAERLAKQLGLTPGSVSPFGLIHDEARSTRVVLDEDLRRAERLIFHPNVNTASVTISLADFERFLTWRGNPVRWVKL